MMKIKVIRLLSVPLHYTILRYFCSANNMHSKRNHTRHVRAWRITPDVEIVRTRRRTIICYTNGPPSYGHSIGIYFQGVKEDNNPDDAGGGGGGG